MQRQSLKLFFPEDITTDQNTLNLSPEMPYLDFEIDITEEEIISLDKLNITNDNDYITYNQIDQLLAETDSFIQKLGDGNSQISLIIATLIVRLVSQVMEYFHEVYGREAAIVEIRAKKPNALFKTPRWHQDGDYFPERDENGNQLPLSCKVEHYKAVAVLKGPGTLFYRPSQKDKEFMHELERERPPIEVVDGKPDLQAAYNRSLVEREMLAKFFDKSKATSPKFGMGSIFISSAKYAAVHSEPDITTQRLFLSVTPGSKKQIQEREKYMGKNTIKVKM